MVRLAQRRASRKRLQCVSNRATAGAQAYSSRQVAVRTRQRGTAPGVWRCIIYIMRRTQLFLDDQLWAALHARARSEKTTISELVRQAARERYLGLPEARMAAMQGFVGIRKSRANTADSSE